MDSRSSERVDSSNQEKIEIRDVQGILRRSLNDKQLLVTDYTASSFVPNGENYASLIVKLDVTIRRQNTEKEEMLHLVAKMIRETETPVIVWPEVLKKEVFVYSELIPMYRELEKEMNIAENDLLDILPKYMGHRYSLSEEIEVDEHSLLLMENLKAQGYYVADRRKGLDLQHAKFALLSLARYHALGIALRIKRPDYFEKVKAEASVEGVNLDLINEGLDIILKTFQENSYFAKHLPVIETCFSNIKTEETYLDVTEPWVTIAHGDFWVNNLMFHKNVYGEIDSVKFIDFQTYVYSSPQKDLAYYFCCSLEDYCLDHHLDELIDLYYSTFTAVLQRMNCDVKPFTRSSFDKELDKLMVAEFPNCALAIKYFCHEVTEEQRSDKEILTSIMECEPSEIYKKKLIKVVDTYERNGWF